MKADPENLLKNLIMLRAWMNKKKNQTKNLKKILSLKWKVTETP